MHRHRAPFSGPGTLFASQCWADCIISMSGFDLRQAQRGTHIGYPSLPGRSRTMVTFGPRSFARVSFAGRDTILFEIGFRHWKWDARDVEHRATSTWLRSIVRQTRLCICSRAVLTAGGADGRNGKVVAWSAPADGFVVVRGGMADGRPRALRTHARTSTETSTGSVQRTPCRLSPPGHLS
jgi:hypothetical protein